MRICSAIYHCLMGLLPETRNVVQLGAGFFFIFLAFNSQGFIEEPVIESSKGIDSGAGYYSLAIIYFVFTFANFVAAPIVDIITAKWAMVLGGCCYAAFLAGFLFLNAAYLYISSAVLGFGAAIIWTGQGTYLAKNCTEQTSGRNSSMLWAMLQGSLVGGGIFLFATFQASGTTDHIAEGTVKILYSVFTVLAILGIVIIAFLPPPPAHLAVATNNGERKDYAQLIVSTFKLMPNRNMLFLAIVFAYTGIEQSFWTGIYPSCISFTKQLGGNTNSLVALNAILSGLGQCIAGGLFGVLGSKTAKLGRDMIVLMGGIIHLVAFGLVFLNFPFDANLKKTDEIGFIQPNVPIALGIGFLLGFGDACWNTQIYAHLVANFPKQSSQAFALYKFYQSALSCAAFFYSPSLQLPYHLIIMVVFSLLAAVAFFIVERMSKRTESSRRSSEDEIIETDPPTYSETVDSP
ncbi:hypothetical protein PFISCL1PPCAC_24271 [Pristionchus fissidentatus]|uniref:UNC93-like protein MFSD11 n=1 Tax=Pristionchus fissidentatus TaxID=1538716 RepID=A0AAV5WLI8_9BILA|nr:hypothetical protein PFISCL1PPCAC_24271 [Pristionchus fissidentatus]